MILSKGIFGKYVNGKQWEHYISQCKGKINALFGGDKNEFISDFLTINKNEKNIFYFSKTVKEVALSLDWDKEIKITPAQIEHLKAYEKYIIITRDDFYILLFDSARSIVFHISNKGVDFIIHPYADNDINDHTKINVQLYKLLFFSLSSKFTEIKVINDPIKQSALDDNKKLRNDVLLNTKISVININANWYRTTYSKHEFAVRGHFRLQPYGSRETPYYKPIFISPYIKEGITIKSKKDI